jgi:hypothetical protein
VGKGSQNSKNYHCEGSTSSISSHSSGYSSPSKSQPISLRGGTMKNNMEGLDHTLRLPEFQGIESKDP